MSNKPQSFWSVVGAASLGTFIVGIILVIILIFGISSALGTFSSDIDKALNGEPKVDELKNHTVLELKISKPISDRGYAYFDQNSFNFIETTGINEILYGLEEAKNNDKIDGILLNISFMQTGFTSLEEIRNAILDFKESGKFVYAYSEMMSQGAYYLSSVADKIYLFPSGYMEMKGLSTTIPFLKGTFEKLDIDMQIIRGSNNKYKSAVEPLIADKMSDANKLQTTRFLSGIWNHLRDNIAVSRGLTPEMLDSITNNLMVRNAGQAEKYGLIDGVRYKDELISELKELSSTEEDDKLQLVSFNKFATQFTDKKEFNIEKKETGNIAVVYASGAIQDAKGGPDVISPEVTAKAIKKARQDDKIKAIVLRVNSPGGSALASDVIWRELVLAKAEKPLIVSMGDYAASGGYFIACPADRIFAHQTTITGSIGVFMVLPNTQRFFENNAGVKFDGVGTHKHSSMGVTSMSLGATAKPLTEEEYKILQEEVDHIYNDFKQKVADGREALPNIDAVDSIAQGRVWNGYDALEIGLVDEFGGLQDAIDYAAEQADVSDVKVKSYPEMDEGIEKFMKLVKYFSDAEEESSEEVKVMNPKMDEQLYMHYQKLMSLLNMKGMQARMIESIE